MGNSWRSGQVAKVLTNQPRPRYIWNLFLLFVLGFILSFLSFLLYQVLEDHMCYQTQQIYLEYRDEYLITDSNEFEIVDKDDQNININVLVKNIDIGQPITLTISSVSEKLLQVVSENGQVVYKVSTIQIGPVIAMFLLSFPIVIGFVFMLIAINIKHPKGLMRDFQRKHLSRKK